MPKKDKILILGAGGQIGTELCLSLRKKMGDDNVVASDIKALTGENFEAGPVEQIDIMDAEKLAEVIKRHDITQIYHLAAILSAVGEKNPRLAWEINMNGLLNVLEVATDLNIKKMFWPSSIAVFGKRTPISQSSQYTVTDPHTIYGISKLAGERWCHYYYHKKGLDIRSLRYPGLISYKGAPGGGTTDWAVEIFHEALKNKRYTCFLEADSCLPYMHMEDAIKGTLDLMNAPVDRLSVHSSYNISSMSFTPEDLTQEIQKYIPEFEISYEPDYRREIARNWPASIDDTYAKTDWNWHWKWDISATTINMLEELSKQLNIKKPELLRQGGVDA
ncbi:MAG: NAD-dependent epimerase/dehydratase family protein [Chitinophagales bacterium]